MNNQVVLMVGVLDGLEVEPKMKALHSSVVSRWPYYAFVMVELFERTSMSVEQRVFKFHGRRQSGPISSLIVFAAQQNCYFGSNVCVVFNHAI